MRRLDEAEEVVLSPFHRGEKYFLDEVITACDVRIREGAVVRPESKNRMVREMEKYAPPPSFGAQRQIGAGVLRHSTKTAGARARAAPSFRPMQINSDQFRSDSCFSSAGSIDRKRIRMRQKPYACATRLGLLLGPSLLPSSK